MAKKKVQRPLKVDKLMPVVREHVENGTYLDTRHSTDRMSLRLISRLEILDVLSNGFHERKKDEFKELYNSWNYAVRGKTVDNRALRIVVALEDDMLIITAIDLDA